jgi:hypothetical protein
MTSEADKENSTLLSPDEAFAVLGNETRIQILRVLGRADAPLAFSELYDRVEYDTTANFNYHLDKLEGHFVRRTDEGYALRQPGRRVVQAILSGTVTDDPVVEPTEVDFPCRHCGAPVEVSYSRGEMRLSCTECSGNIDKSGVRDADEDVEYGNLANSSLPPAGVQGRTAADVFRTAATRSHLDALAASSDVCPRCSAPVDHSTSVCDEHDATAGLCDQCDRHYAVLVHFRCTNCIYEEGFPAVMALLNVPELLTFVGEHGLNVTADGIEWGWDFDEEILSTDPFETRFTFTIDGDSITLTVDDGLNVGRVSR